MDWYWYLCFLPLILCFFPLLVAGAKDKRRLKRKKKEKDKDKVNKMSKLLQELAGKRCKLYGDDFYGEECTLLEIDGEWLKIESTDKKGNKTVAVCRTDCVDKVVVVND